MLKLNFRERMRGIWPLFLLALLLLGNTSVADAESAFQSDNYSYLHLEDKGGSGDDSSEWKALDARLGKIDSALAEKGVDDLKQLLLWQKETEALSQSVNEYINILQAQLDQYNSELQTIGAQVDGEPEEVTQKRKTIQEQKAQQEGKLVGYRLLLLHSDTLAKKLSELRQHLLTEELLARGSDSMSLLREHSDLTWRWVTASWQFLSRESGLQMLGAGQMFAYAVLLAAAIMIGVLLRRRCLAWCSSHQDENYHYALLLFAALGQYAPHLLAGLITAGMVQVLPAASPDLFLYHMGITLPLFFASWALLHFLFRGQGESVAAFNLPGRISRGIGRSLKLAVLVGYIGHLAFNTGAMAHVSEAAYFLARDLFVLLLVLSLLWTNHYFRRLMSEHSVRGVGGLLLLFLLSALAAEIIGYRNIAYWALRALIGSSLILFLSWLLVHLLKEFFDSLRLGRLWWQQGLRRLLGYGVEESMPWLSWVYLLAAVALWMVAAYCILLVWGIPAETVTRLSNYLYEGFQIGSLTIIPLRIVIAIVVFAVLLAISGWFRGRLEDTWLTKSRMERGTREAMVTISGYIGVALAILVALGVAGVQFTNLAIIAGALSVGIGFGLQNIVNNFVSGLILLFERPVKTGDWIMVGSTEGYVKRISIRSTLIQTFDRADVIVPNSELISGQVTNWMLYDPRGRVRVPVGVAYGSDTEKVKAILLQIANEHPSVITDGSMTEPKVLFLSFGESSLDFELRAFIKNIDERLQVLSDINFAIDAAFRREGIEIPFPQRDLHLRNWPPKDQL